eukprot:1700606-Rhodomonas_salina.1
MRQNWTGQILKGILATGEEATDERSQTVTFFVTAVVPGFFSQQPALTSDGTLSFAPAPDTVGRAYIQVYMRDDGGTSYGGEGRSATKTFSITIRETGESPPVNLIDVV